MIPHDYHMHSNFSCDSKAPMEAMCHAAVALGLPEIGFTEHFDLNPSDYCPNNFKLEPWALEIERCRALFAGTLVIRAGIEIGEPHIYRAETQALLARHPFDYVLGSLHWLVGGYNVFDDAFFRAEGFENVLARYFAELAQLAAEGDFDVLSHLDVPIRTGLALFGTYDPMPHEAAIRRVLQTCIDRGLALDVNTAALRRAIRALTPGLTILRWYAEMGGTRVTLGSDAHRPDHVGAHLPEALAVLREAGLTQVVQFEKRQGRLITLLG